MGCESITYPHSVTVQSPDPDATPAAGGHIDLTDDANWTDENTIKVRFITKGGREGRVFDQIQAEVSHVLETPSTGFSRTIHPEMRLVFGSRKFNIVAAFDINEERRVVQVHCTEVI